ncbi:MAG: uncharacterized protein QOH33_1823, partial [Paraburkholderia sp.]|nr:uncharacterized protein [Paraburkholderia sp.]
MYAHVLMLALMAVIAAAPMPAAAARAVPGTPAAASASTAPTAPTFPARIPGFHGPPASAISASGPVQADPAHMPFYVATKGATTIYLLGTLHVGDPADYPAGQPFRRPILAALAA